jgi:hypothetical protein
MDVARCEPPSEEMQQLWALFRAIRPGLMPSSAALPVHLTSRGYLRGDIRQIMAAAAVDNVRLDALVSSGGPPDSGNAITSPRGETIMFEHNGAMTCALSTR